MANKKADLRKKINNKQANKNHKSTTTKSKSIKHNINELKSKKIDATTQKPKRNVHDQLNKTSNYVTNSNNRNKSNNNSNTRSKKNNQNKQIKNNKQTLEKKTITKNELKELVKEEKELLKNNTKEQKENKKIEKKNNKKSKKNFKSNKIANIIKSFINIIWKNKKIIVIVVIAVITVLFLVLAIYKSKNKIVFNFKSYKIGDKVTLQNDSSWYVIKDSSISDSDVTLISEKILDINKDKKIDDKDKVQFDTENKTSYEKSNKNNIGFFMKDTVSDLLKDVGNIKNIRLLKSDEYIAIRKSMKFGYDWNEGNWLANDSVNSWWLETSRYNKIYIVSKKGSYRLVDAKSKYYVRPVITIAKGEIKANK